MAVGLVAPKALPAVKGCRLATVVGNLRYQGRHDLLLIELPEGASTVAVFTQNKFAAAPVSVARQHLADTCPRAMLINAGNANAGTGKLGLANALRCCDEVAKLLQIEPGQVLPFSTGVIGEQMDMEKMVSAINLAHQGLGESDWLQAANAIITTDTLPKGASRKVEIAGQRTTITGIAKGAGMICPNMATMLAFVATDATVDQTVLEQMMQRATAQSFNRITVDSDTSTNDAVVLVATSAQAMPEITALDSDEAQGLYQAIESVFIELATAIVRDAEGATKFVTVEVTHAATKSDSRSVAYAVAHSPLVKTALFASDPNWGRILAAVGKAPCDALEIDSLNLTVNGVLVVERGEPAANYTEARGQAAFAKPEIHIVIDLAQGAEAFRLWTSDLSQQYVSINADYRS